jgi:hypothetical protein
MALSRRRLGLQRGADKNVPSAAFISLATHRTPHVDGVLGLGLATRCAPRVDEKKRKKEASSSVKLLAGGVGGDWSLRSYQHV